MSPHPQPKKRPPKTKALLYQTCQIILLVYTHINKTLLWAHAQTRKYPRHIHPNNMHLPKMTLKVYYDVCFLPTIYLHMYLIYVVYTHKKTHRYLRICVPCEKPPHETLWSLKSKSRVFVANHVQIHSNKTSKEKTGQSSPGEDRVFHLWAVHMTGAFANPSSDAPGHDGALFPSVCIGSWANRGCLLFQNLTVKTTTRTWTNIY